MEVRVVLNAETAGQPGLRSPDASFPLTWAPPAAGWAPVAGITWPVSAVDTPSKAGAATGDVPCATGRIPVAAPASLGRFRCPRRGDRLDRRFVRTARAPYPAARYGIGTGA